MTFTFDYEETLCRRIKIDAKNFQDAMNELYRKIDNEEIVLGSEDFAGGQISIPLDNEHNFTTRLNHVGEEVKDSEDYDVVIDWW